jgi:UDP-glucose 4-epimerase
MTYEALFKDKIVLITGGTGSFGNRILKRMANMGAKEIRVFSRDEKKQYDMKNAYKDMKHVKYFVGDIRDKKRLREVMEGVNIVYQAAALKQVPSCEYCPEEAIKTNILGVMNLIECALDAKVEKVVAISTDKAVKPVNVMGMTKAIQEKIIINANLLPNNKGTLFSCVRYGNVMSSRGSAIPFFRDLIKAGKAITITHPEMTRFMLTLDDAIDLVFYATQNMKGKETFVKKAPSMKIVDLAKLLYKMHHGTDNGFRYETIGMLPGEKIHEILISEEEMRRSSDNGSFFVIKSIFDNPDKNGSMEEYCSKDVITDENEILALIKKADKAAEEEYYSSSVFVK